MYPKLTNLIIINFHEFRIIPYMVYGKYSFIEVAVHNAQT